MMVSVLLRLKASSDILEQYPNLSAYVARGEARPAYKRAFDAQLEVFNRSEEHTSELQSLMRISYAVLCLKKKLTAALVDTVSYIQKLTLHTHEHHREIIHT